MPGHDPVELELSGSGITRIGRESCSQFGKKP